MAKAAQDGRRGDERSWPDIDESIVLHLESLYPPRTLGKGETVGDHLRYAGACDLVQTLRFMLNAQQADLSEA